jgi:hypothetical protein
MDTHTNNTGDLSDLERCLASCEPARDGLDADSMLFAAGRASARPGKAHYLWPALTTSMAALALVLGIWLALERAERQSLARLLQEATGPRPTPAEVKPEPPSADQPPHSGVLVRHGIVDEGLETGPGPAVVQVEPPGSQLPDPPILRVGRPDMLPDL